MTAPGQALITQKDWKDWFQLPLYNGDCWLESMASVRCEDLLDHPRSPFHAENDIFGFVVAYPESGLADLFNETARQSGSYNIFVTFKLDDGTRMDLLVGLDTYTRADGTLERFSIPFNRSAITPEEIRRRPTIYTAWRVNIPNLNLNSILALNQPPPIVDRRVNYPDYMTYMKEFHGL